MMILGREGQGPLTKIQKIQKIKPQFASQIISGIFITLPIKEALGKITAKRFCVWSKRWVVKGTDPGCMAQGGFSLIDFASRLWNSITNGSPIAKGSHDLMVLRR